MRCLRNSELWSANLDWLSFTQPKGSRDANRLTDIGCAMLYELEKQGHIPKEKHMHGFVGLLARGLFFGENGERVFLQASGQNAPEVLKEMKANDCWPRCTRADVENTTRVKGDVDKACLKIGSVAKKHCETYGGSLPSRFAPIENKRGGASYSIGKRGRTRFHTAYNKSAQSNYSLAPNLLRLETKFGRALAQGIFCEFMEAPDTKALAVQVCVDEWARLGVSIPWAGKTVHYSLPSTYEPTDDERRLAYTEGTVAAMFAKLETSGLLGRAIELAVSGKSERFREDLKRAALERARMMENWSAQTVNA